MIVKKLKIKTSNGEILKQIRFLDYPIAEYKKVNGKIKIHSIFPYTKQYKSNTFFLKVNQESDFLFLCIQQWVDVASIMEAHIIFICDKYKIKNRILRDIVFVENVNVSFIVSDKSMSSKKIIRNVTTDKYWIKPSLAHLTTFVYAKKYNIRSFWNIDADDTLFCMSPKILAKHLISIQQYADNNDIDAFSLDMHTSKTQEWTFGVTYTRMSVDWFLLFYRFAPKADYQQYLGRGLADNLDFFFEYLRRMGYAKNEVFYIDNTYFIHGGTLLPYANNNKKVGCVYKWQNNKITFPIITDLLKNYETGEIPICCDCVKFESNTSQQDSFDYLYKHLDLCVKSIVRRNGRIKNGKL